MAGDRTLYDLFDALRAGRGWKEFLPRFRTDDGVALTYDKFKGPARAVDKGSVIAFHKLVAVLAKARPADFATLNLTTEDQARFEELLVQQQAELDRWAISRLREAGLLEGLFSPELDWLLLPVNRYTKPHIDEWQVTAVNNRFQFFLETFYHWQRLVAEKRNRRETGRLARPLAWVAISYGMFTEALTACQYGITYFGERLGAKPWPEAESDDSEYDDRLRHIAHDRYQYQIVLSRLQTLQGVAFGRLGDTKKAQSFFNEALVTAESAKADRDVGSFDSEAPEYHLAVRDVRREWLRTFCAAALDDLPRAVDQSWDGSEFLASKGLAQKDFLQELKQFEEACNEQGASLPIDWDTVGRAKLLFAGRTPESLVMVREAIDKASALLERAQGPHASALSRDSIYTSQIVYHLVKGEVDEAEQVYDGWYHVALPAQDRKLTLRRWQAISAILGKQGFVE